MISPRECFVASLPHGYLYYLNGFLLPFNYQLILLPKTWHNCPRLLLEVYREPFLGMFVGAIWQDRIILLVAATYQDTVSHFFTIICQALFHFSPCESDVSLLRYFFILVFVNGLEYTKEPSHWLYFLAISHVMGR